MTGSAGASSNCLPGACRKRSIWLRWTGQALAETLHLAAALGGLPPLVDIYGVEIHGCADQHLSDVAEVAATRLASILAGLGR